MRTFVNFYFEFEYTKHRTIKRDMKRQSGDAKVSRIEANNPTHDTKHTRALNPKNSVGVRTSDPPIRGSRLFPTKPSRPAEKITGRKFRPCVRSFDKHITCQRWLVFEGLLYIPLHLLSDLLLTLPHQNRLLSFQNLSPLPPSANP